MTTAEGRRRLRRVAAVCENFGQRVQYSVCECQVGEKEWIRLKHDLLEEMNPDQDCIRFYFLGEVPERRTEHHGQRPSLNFAGPLIV